jgi:hypothetical protein
VTEVFAAVGVVTVALLVMLVAASVAVWLAAILGLRFHWRPFFLGVSPEGAPFTAAIGSEARLPEGAWSESRPSRKHGWWVRYVWMPWGWAAFETKVPRG